MYQASSGSQWSPSTVPQQILKHKEMTVAARRLKIHSSAKTFNQRFVCQSWLKKVSNSFTTELKL